MEHIPMNVWWLKCFICTHSSDDQSAFDELKEIIIYSFTSFLSFLLNELLQSEIKQKLSSFKKNTCVTAIADKKIISMFCVSGVLCSSPKSDVQVK